MFILPCEVKALLKLFGFSWTRLVEVVTWQVWKAWPA